MLSEKAFRYITGKPKRFNILHGSVRSGKTTSGLLALPERILRAPHGDVVDNWQNRTHYLPEPHLRRLQQMYGPGRVSYSKGMGRRAFRQS